MAKCDTCSKNITKRSPGLECNKCAKIVHANQLCSSLSSKQLSALRNADNLEWTCEECLRDSPRRSSFVIPEEDDEEEVDACGLSQHSMFDMAKLLRNISGEVKKVIQKEMVVINDSVSFCSKKIDDLTDTLVLYGGKIKELETKNIHLTNQNMHLELKMAAIEQHLRDVEQKNLEKFVEVAGVPVATNENLETITNNLVAKMNMERSEVVSVKRIRGRNAQEGFIHVELKDVQHAEQWVRASRNETITVQQITPGVPTDAVASKVWIRRALTKINKTLLWKARQSLQETYKYIWFQDGKILARKGDNEKPVVIRCEEDIIKISSPKNPNR